MLNPPSEYFFLLATALDQCDVMVAMAHVETAFNLGFRIILWLLKTGRQIVQLYTISLYRLALGRYYPT